VVAFSYLDEPTPLSWEGEDDSDPGCGRGWPVLEGEELLGRSFMAATIPAFVPLERRSLLLTNVQANVAFKRTHRQVRASTRAAPLNSNVRRPR
jgi:hypothetical protein